MGGFGWAGGGRGNYGVAKVKGKIVAAFDDGYLIQDTYSQHMYYAPCEATYQVGDVCEYTKGRTATIVKKVSDYESFF